MSRAKQRADRIRADVSITRLLSDYGYNVYPEGGGREQQFQCDLHGDGSDNKPSARVYPDTNSWYCFGCGKVRDAIQTAREKEGLDFWAAIQAIEARYALPPLPWEEEHEEEAKALSETIRDSLKSDLTFEEERVRVDRLLMRMTEERETPLPLLLGLWEAFDRVCYGVAYEDWPETKGKASVLAIRERAMKYLQDKNEAAP